MREDGKSILIITHKLHEVLSISDRVAILRKGEHVATVNTAETSAEELTEMMQDEKTEVSCQFCDKKYIFTPSDIGNLIRKAKK